MITIKMKEENQQYLLEKIYFEWLAELKCKYRLTVNIDYLEQLLDVFKELSGETNSELINYMQQDLDTLKGKKSKSSDTARYVK